MKTEELCKQIKKWSRSDCMLTVDDFARAVEALMHAAYDQFKYYHIASQAEDILFDCLYELEGLTNKAEEKEVPDDLKDDDWLEFDRKERESWARVDAYLTERKV